MTLPAFCLFHYRLFDVPGWLGILLSLNFRQLAVRMPHSKLTFRLAEPYKSLATHRPNNNNAQVSVFEGIRQNLDNQEKTFIQPFFSTMQWIMAGNDTEGLRYGSFVQWYNVDHRHSGIRYVSPAQRHAGDDQALLAARHALYLQARERHPARWSGDTRNWAPIGAVTLNPERDSVIKAHLAEHDMQPLAA